ncbi:hypothetical protein NQ176_g5699 [Zarea fungicola]|uniref:Uncharacterized protein n=1 Tax=Zarea fungicola TaxID=93591 RepID=A0ACC1N8K1_9HYPO|nr:hypothetical protein NQ176_g5699 [Lecanicillium fungicola]
MTVTKRTGGPPIGSICVVTGGRLSQTDELFDGGEGTDERGETVPPGYSSPTELGEPSWLDADLPELLTCILLAASKWYPYDGTEYLVVEDVIDDVAELSVLNVDELEVVAAEEDESEEATLDVFTDEELLEDLLDREEVSHALVLPVALLNGNVVDAERGEEIADVVKLVDEEVDEVMARSLAKLLDVVVNTPTRLEDNVSQLELELAAAVLSGKVDDAVVVVLENKDRE